MASYKSAAHSDVGMKREHNEDSFLVNEDLGLYVVCDGMGGHAGGETASRLAVQTIERELISARLRADNPFKDQRPLAESPLAEALREAVEGACAAVFRTSRKNPELAGMGTTCISLLMQGDHAIVGHVGDSRAYMVRAGEVWQLSEDHSLVNEQVRAGLLTSEEAKHSRLKNIITRSVGFEEDVLVDVIGVETQPGDRFLLCSDGLSNLVDATEIRDALEQADVADVPSRLVQLANARGGDDNITVVAIERVG
ncbi:MAG TPA: Stp1/IreP family PP2C-type Ser/Thr phosphatase [Myxococcales bacterium]|jgi:serine/threonine protein phosphatase PrpC|nr:Stp1/IreP family PP2C-type Ser/Thr phosphatase [Myxococcales bacterium]